MKRGCISAALAALAALAFGASTALASPAPPYQDFTGCPNTPASVHLCTITTITGGHLALGNTDTPINQPMVLKGGLNVFTGDVSATAEGGLNAPNLEVPGGLLGLTGWDWLVNFLTFNQLKVYAHAELAGAPHLSPTGVTLPLKIRLINGVLSNTCYIGSTSNPVVLNLTTGTTSPPPPNSPISGTPGTLSTDPATSISTASGVYVDNAFSAPAASGCTMLLPGTGLIDPIVNLRAGLPAAAGHNTAVQNYTLKTAPRPLVFP